VLPSTKQRGFKLFRIVGLDSRNHIISNHIRNHIPNHTGDHIISNHTIISNHIDKKNHDSIIYELIFEEKNLETLFFNLEKKFK
jgi:uncharacterized protein YktB (UPF0637 family)